MADLNRRVNKDDPFLLQYQPSDLQIASEFLSTWLPFLSRDLCRNCTRILSNRIRSLDQGIDCEAEPSPSSNGKAFLSPKGADAQENCCSDNHGKSTGSCLDGDDTHSLGSWEDGADGLSESVLQGSTSGIHDESPPIESPSPRMSWADMAQEDDEFVEEEEKHKPNMRVVNVNESTGRIWISKAVDKPKLSWDERDYIRFMNVTRKKDFICLERVNGKFVNILDGLELHTGVFSAAEQKRIVNCVYEFVEMGKRGELKARTYTAPQKWMRGKGRVTIQFGCCYNYATDKNGNPPGILQNETVDPIPELFKVIIRRLVRWHVIPRSCVPDSCIVNIYDKEDCIPPHIDNHDFVRPFCTVSFLSQCDIVFGTNLKILGAGEFSGPYAIPLPVGSVLVINGNGADVAKHCVPSVPAKRISITFRKMDESKRPKGFVPETDLQDIQPLPHEAEEKNSSSSPKPEPNSRKHSLGRTERLQGRGYLEDSSQSQPHDPTRGWRGPAYKYRR